MNPPAGAMPAHRPLAMPGALLAALTVSSAGLLMLSAVLAAESLEPLSDPVGWLASLDVDAAFDILSNTAEVVAAVLAIAITVVAIVVELAANRYSHEITRLFLREPVNLLVLGLFVVTTLQCVWTAASMDEANAEALVPQAGFAITLALVTVCLLLLVPYIYFVFTFLSPVSVIRRICQQAYRVILGSRRGRLGQRQARVEEAVDQLQDVARSAIVRGDRSIAMAAIDALTGLVRDYVRVRDRLPDAWFQVTEAVANDPDFVALAPETLDEVQRQGLWLERKVFRRLLSLMGESAGEARDVANLIGIDTRRIATEFGPRHPHLLELCLRSFNSYLRTTINARDPRTAYFLMNQYRLVAERLLEVGETDAPVRIAGHLREYGQLAHQAGLSFLLETTAYDLTRMIEHAMKAGPAIVDDLLTCLLELDQEIKEESHEESLLGVRRSQIQLATLFLQRGDRQRAQRIADDLSGEPMERLERLRRRLLADDRPQFWELIDRGMNFAYLDPARRAYLEPLFRELIQGRAREPAAS